MFDMPVAGAKTIQLEHLPALSVLPATLLAGRSLMVMPSGATLQLSAGVHFMQVSKWLGHSTFTLTLDTYGDYIPEQDGGALNNLPEPHALTVAPDATALPLRLVN